MDLVTHFLLDTSHLHSGTALCMDEKTAFAFAFENSPEMLGGGGKCHTSGAEVSSIWPAYSPYKTVQNEA